MPWKTTCAALAIALSATACAPAGPAGPEAACAAFRPIYLAPAEVEALTAETAAAVLAHNETGVRVCGW